MTTYMTTDMTSRHYTTCKCPHKDGQREDPPPPPLPPSPPAASSTVACPAEVVGVVTKQVGLISQFAAHLSFYSGCFCIFIIGAAAVACFVADGLKYFKMFSITFSQKYSKKYKQAGSSFQFPFQFPEDMEFD